MKYTYLVGGITISSDIFYPELVTTSQQPQVELCYGAVPEHLEVNTVDFPFIEANENQYLLKLENVGAYLVENGKKITIELAPGGNKSDLEKYVLTNVFGALSYQRNCIPMHGGVFVKDGKGTLITGISGLGKSTLMAALLKQGYHIISDDISNIELIDGQLIAHPFCPYLLLWKDTIKNLELGIQNGHKFREDMVKYFFPIPPQQYLHEKIELKNIIVLTGNDKESDQQIKGLKKIEALKTNTFKPWMINTFNKQKELFKELMFIADKVSIENFYNDRNKAFSETLDLFLRKFEGYAE